MTPGLAAATAMAAAIQAASDADQLPEEVEASATYYANRKPEELKATEEPKVYVKPLGFASSKADRSGKRQYEVTVRVALRHRAAPDSMDALFDELVALVDRNERFAGLAVVRIGMPEVFAPDLYEASGIVALDADVELLGYPTY